MRAAAYPVVMDAAERDRIERRLDARLEELVRTRAAAAARPDDDSELAHLDQHPGDMGSETHDREMDATTAIFFEEEERRIAEARRALADGSYGTCQGCGRQIPAERLLAMPEAVRCIDCQRHFEGRHRQLTA
jgi:RNA polymerase-binding transcription factor DksA